MTFESYNLEGAPMTTKPYNGFPAAYRNKRGAVQTELFKSGELRRPTECVMCELTRMDGAIIHAHCEDYHNIAEYQGLCFCCHMAVHRRFQEINLWHDWRDLMTSGRQPPKTWDYKFFMDKWFHLPILELVAEDINLDNWSFTLPDLEPDLYTGREQIF